MPPTPLHLAYQLYETAWKAFIAIPLTLARPLLDRASREHDDA